MDKEESKIMILKFRTKNFKSVKDLIEIDFVANKKQKDKNDSLIDVHGQKILPVISIYGANGSGKSNIIKALFAMSRAMVERKEKTGRPFIVSYAYNDDTMKEPTFFEVELCHVTTGNVYRYGFECDKKVIFEEWLYLSNISNPEEEEIFYRNVQNAEFISKSDKYKELCEEITEAAEMAKEHELVLSIFSNRLTQLMGEGQKIENEDIIGLEIELYNMIGVLEFSRTEIEELDILMLKNAAYDLKDNDVLSYAMEIIKEIDTSILRIEHDTKQDEDLNEINILYTIRLDDNGEEKRLPASIESSGTKKMLYLAEHLSFVLKVGGVFAYDELDLKLHPLLFRKIIRMFNNKEINKNGAQLLFSSHNLICLDSSDLRRDSIYFAEKINNVTDVYSLSDIKIKGELVRADLDFEKHYLAGRFGAVPFQEEYDK